PYSWPVIGSMADLSAASVTDVQNFFKTYYAPNNATLIIAGDFNPVEAKRLVAQYFSEIPRGPAVKRRTTVPAVTVPRDTFLLLEDKVQLPRVYYTWHTVKGYSRDDAALDILAQILANDKNSRLYKKLVYEQQTAQSVYKSNFLNDLASVLGKAEVLNSYNYFIGNPDYVQQDAARYDAVTAAD